MRKEENTEKDELYGKLQVHFIENELLFLLNRYRLLLLIFS